MVLPFNSKEENLKSRECLLTGEEVKSCNERNGRWGISVVIWKILFRNGRSSYEVVGGVGGRGGMQA